MNDQSHLEDRLVVSELCRAGVHVESSQDLITQRAPYPLAIPVLIAMLATVETYAIREVIVRSLAVREAKGKAEKTLIAEFEASLHDSSVDAQAFRWAIANTLEVIGGKNDVDALIRILLDPRSGRARGLLSIAASKTKDPRVIPILFDLLDSADFQGFAWRGLGILHVEEAGQKLKEIAETTTNSWIRREAVKALGRIGKSTKR